jgi:hypothetical protein
LTVRANYSVLDRLVHRLAFCSPKVQLAAADLEQMAFGKVYEDVEVRPPVFIASLPRSGSTILLEGLYRFPTLATQLYRDMPFIMSPILWSRLSGSFRATATLRERAHGDQLQIGYDSPESFEEVLWQAFWPEKYGEATIGLWDATDYMEEAWNFFSNHMKKVVALRLPTGTSRGRYLAKNNANIARLDLLERMFPNACIVLPIRHPIQHARSLHRQHLNFLRIHATDRFALRYMSDIGHHEFGLLHKPFAFPNLDMLTGAHDPLDVDYWLGYWIAVFDFALARRDKLIIVPHEQSVADHAAMLIDLGETLGIGRGDVPEEALALFKEPISTKYDIGDLDPSLCRRAEDLYNALLLKQG